MENQLAPSVPRTTNKVRWFHQIFAVNRGKFVDDYYGQPVSYDHRVNANIGESNKPDMENQLGPSVPLPQGNHITSKNQEVHVTRDKFAADHSAQPTVENHLAVKCGKCRLTTTMTSRAHRFRCSGCGNEIVIQSNREMSYEGRGPDSIFAVNRSKAVADYGLMETYDCNPNSVNITANGGACRGKRVGRRRALVCGVSYKRQKYELKGTLIDALRMNEFLLGKGFSPNDIWMLIDKTGYSLPTRKNMEVGMRWLVEGCQDGDSLVFYFSGHGINQPDNAGDEIDGLDESLCPLDFSSNGVILDKQLNDVLVRPLPSGVTLHAIVDACHSGTILDLPWVCDPKSRNQPWLDNQPPSGANKGTSGGLAISLNACRDDQIAADTSAFTKIGVSGVMTSCFIQAIESARSDLTYHQLLVTMQGAISKAPASPIQVIMDRFLHRNFLQEPLLSSSEKFDPKKEKFRL